MLHGGGGRGHTPKRRNDSACATWDFAQDVPHFASLERCCSLVMNATICDCTCAPMYCEKWQVYQKSVWNITCCLLGFVHVCPIIQQGPGAPSNVFHARDPFTARIWWHQHIDTAIDPWSVPLEGQPRKLKLVMLKKKTCELFFAEYKNANSFMWPLTHQLDHQPLALTVICIVLLKTCTLLWPCHCFEVMPGRGQYTTP